jgi:hypothetical protein
MSETANTSVGGETKQDARSRRRISWVRALVCGIVGAALILAAFYFGFIAPYTGNYSAAIGLPASPNDNTKFALENTVIPPGEIKTGGVPKDGIPALTDPKMLPADEATYLKADDRVIGVSIGQQARAYPLRVLNWHEIVNDQLGGTPVAVTYCPLCDSSAVFHRRVGTETVEFGVSGLLYNSNVLMYDRLTNSLWSQLMAQGMSGPYVKRQLKPVPFELTTWADWRQRHPATEVLSIDTGHARDYDTNSYEDYFRSSQLWFPVSRQNGRLEKKHLVLGVWTDNASRAYPLSAFDGEDRQLTDEIDGRHITLRYDAKAKSLTIDSADEGVKWMYSFWFAWYAFRPETDIYSASREGD